MSDTSDLITPSDEALDFFEALSEPDGSEVVEEEQPDQDAADEDEPSDDPESPVQDVEEDDDEGSDDEEDEQVAAVKDDIDWEKRYKDLQSHADKQVNEQREYARQLAERMEQLEQRTVQQQQQSEQQAVQSVTNEQIEAGVKANPVAAFQWALANRPDIAPGVISMIRAEHGDVHADQAQAAYSAFHAQQAAAVAEERFRQLEHQREMEMAPQVVEEGLRGILERLSGNYGEAFERLSPRLNELVQENGVAELGSAPSPQQVEVFVERQLLAAMREEIASGKQQRAPKKVSKSDFVEDGAPAKRPGKPSEDEQEVNDIVDAFKEWRYT